MIFGIIKTYSIDKIKAIMSEHTILLTGIPRSGTTLACKLIHQHSSAVALNEPFGPETFRDTISTSVNLIIQGSKQIRQQIFKERKAPARTKNRAITDNAYDDQYGKRVKVVTRSLIHIDKAISEDFTLILKHNAEFALLLPALLQHFSVFGMIRNPLATLLSWNSVDIAVSRGKVSKAQWLDKSFESEYLKISDLHHRQVFILNWYFQKMKLLRPSQLIKYEDLIDSNASILHRIYPLNEEKLTMLNSKNFNPLYDKELVEKFVVLLIRFGGNWQDFYTEKDIKDLADLYSNTR